MPFISFRFLLTVAALASLNQSVAATTQPDTEKPNFIDCPVEITAFADANGQAIVEFPTPTATDNSGEVTVTLDRNRKPSGSTFNLGVSVVKFTARDPSGNSKQCSFNVRVIEKDTTKPKFLFCPIDMDITVPNRRNANEVQIFYQEPIATDNSCDNGTECVTLQLQPNRKASGDFYRVGSTSIIKWRAFDPTGNSVECSFRLTVNDNNNRRRKYLR